MTSNSRLRRLGRRSGGAGEPDPQAPRTGPSTLTAELRDGPLNGRRLEVEPVEGRPPKTVDADAADGGTCRYCLAEWSQGGASADYTFLYRV